MLLISCKQEANSKKDAEIKFSKTSHNFGKVELNNSVSHGFRFFNPGKDRLVILDISTSCGCTVADWPREPLKKGDKEQINVAFDASVPGKFQKSVAVFYNGPDSPDTLIVKGKVERKEN